jgi:N12 class adenine-specific DNA methylase
MPLRAKDADRFLDQLSLFANQEKGTQPSIAAMVITADPTDVRLSATHQPNDPPALDLRSSRNGGDPRSIGSTTAVAQPSERTASGNALPTGDGEKDGLQCRSGDRSPRVECLAEPNRPVTTLARDFRFSPSLAVGHGIPSQKAAGNLEAIRLLQVIEREQRPATYEEKLILVQYTGWGALPQLFSPEPAAEWKNAARELKTLLGDTDYAAARASTPNAHYTSAPVITAIWDTLLRLGVTSSLHILEPAAGIGHFFGLMPANLVHNTVRVGIELDPVSARIAQLLYPDSHIRTAGFETVALPNGFFDLAVGNVPFGNYPVFDPQYRKQTALTRSIHDYFLAKSVDLVRPGGLLALITSRHTLDKQSSAVRQYIAGKANLIAAVRLPNGTFLANAGTSVTTDLLFLQRRETADTEQAPAWLHLKTLETADGPVTINEYFVDRPQNMLGTPALESTQYQNAEFTLNGNFCRQRFGEALRSVPNGLYASVSNRVPILPPSCEHSSEWTAIKDGAYGLVDNALVIRNGDSLDPVYLGKPVECKIRLLLVVRDAIRQVLRTQLENAAEEEIISARRQLNLEYDRFFYRFGPISAKDNFRAFAGDPDHPLLLSLEDYDPDTKRAAKTPIFHQRTIEGYQPVERVDTAAEALVVSLNETGQVDWVRMAALTGGSIPALQHELTGLVFQNPEGNKWEPADAYLSGDVRQKLRTAEAAASVSPEFSANVNALQTVQPQELEPGDIDARLGSPWIPVPDIQSFLCELLSTEAKHFTIWHAESIATWTVELGYAAKYAAPNTTTYGTARFTAGTLVEHALNNRTPTAYDEVTDAEGRSKLVVNQNETLAARERQQELKDNFQKWIWQDKDRAKRLARQYNDQFNNLRLRTYDGSHLTFPGMCRHSLRNGDLGPHQKNAAWRILQSNSTLIGHVVGAGKTFTLVAAAMELKRLGLAKKTMFVVPNHLVEQWATEFLKLYPHANLFVAGKDQFSTGNRQRAMARIATGHYDAIIVSFRSFEYLPLSDELFKRFLEEEISEIDEELARVNLAEGENRRIVKQLETAKKRLKVRFEKRANRENKDNGITFEAMGISQIMVDEADAYKNLAYTSKMQRIAGLPNSDSFRAFDMYLKIRYIQQSPHTRGVVFATGTPISNTLAEMYTVLRYLAPKLLENTGTRHFDAWAANFAEAVTALELAPDGSGYRMNTRFARFINMPELLTMFRSVADIQTADMLQLPRPKLETGKPIVEAVPASDTLKQYIQTLIKRAEALKKEKIDPSADNMLKITGDGRKAALDLRLVGLVEQPEHETKLKRAVQRIFAVWQDTAAERGTQLVFCDLSTPDPQRWNVYDEVREQLVRLGVTQQEIAFIHDADTDAKKKLLFDAINGGRVRILMGSTEKMGAGTNVQKRLAALTHLDGPWRPRDIEQREGRILRQGNRYEEVRIYRHVTAGSFDAYMWQLLEVKARFIAQVMCGDVSTRRVEDLENAALTFAEIKAIASGNPLVMEKVRVDTEIRKLDALRASHQNQLFRVVRELSELPFSVDRSRQMLAHMHADIALRDQHDSESFAMTIGNRIFSGKGAREEAGKALTYLILTWKDDEARVVRAQFRGFDIVSQGKRPSFLESNPVPSISVRGSGTYSATLNPANPAGTIQSIEYTLRSLERAAERERERLQQLESNLAAFQWERDKPFEHEGRLRELLLKQTELNMALDLHKSDSQAAGVAEQPEDHAAD